MNEVQRLGSVVALVMFSLSFKDVPAPRNWESESQEMHTKSLTKSRKKKKVENCSAAVFSG